MHQNPDRKWDGWAEHSNSLSGMNGVSSDLSAPRTVYYWRNPGQLQTAPLRGRRFRVQLHRGRARKNIGLYADAHTITPMSTVLRLGTGYVPPPMCTHHPAVGCMRNVSTWGSLAQRNAMPTWEATRIYRLPVSVSHGQLKFCHALVIKCLCSPSDINACFRTHP